MNMFKSAKRVYIRLSLDGEVQVLRLDKNGDAYESKDLEKFGRQQGDKLTDSEIAELFRKLEAEGLEVNIQNI